MSTQEKRLISVRLPGELLDWAEGYGRSLRWDRTTVITAALESFREDVAGGVPDVPKARPGLEEAPVPNPPAPPRASGAKPERTSFESGEEWQNAVRLWKAREMS